MANLIKYTATDTVLADLHERFGSAVWDVSTPDGMEHAKKSREELRRWRLGVEEERKKKKRQLLDDGKTIDDEAKRITAKIVVLETPCADAIEEVARAKKAEKEAKELAERERMEECQAEIDRIRNIPVGLVGANAEALQRHVDELDACDTTALDEFSDAALSIKLGVLTKLRDMHANVQEQEAEMARVAAERAELDRLRAEQEERDRIAKEKQDAEDRERRAKLDADEKASRERIAEDEREAREARAKADAGARQLREAEETRLREQREKLEAEQRAKAEADRVEREAHEAQEREKRRQEALRLDGRELLRTFVGQYGEAEEFANVVEAIRAYFAEAGHVG